MKTINLNFIPQTPDGKPHIIDYTCAKYVAEVLDARISGDNPLLEFNIAQSLRENGTVQLSSEQTIVGVGSEVDYLANVVAGLNIDNRLKGQILKAIVE